VVVDERTHWRRGANEDGIATDIKRRGERITRIVNVHDPKNKHSGGWPPRNLNLQTVIMQGSTVWPGGLNPQSIPWNSRWQVQREAAFCEEVTDENGLDMGIHGETTHQRRRHGHEHESVIDLTLANWPIITWCIEAADDHATGSDHDVMEREVWVDRQEEAGHGKVVGWILAAMTEEDVKAAEKLWMELEKERAHLDAECTADEVEEDGTWCQEDMGNVLDPTAKKIRICAKPKTWWNSDIRDRSKEVRSEKRWGQTSERAGHV